LSDANVSETRAKSGAQIAGRVETFIRDTVVPYEKDPRRDHHNAPGEELVAELRERARAAGVLTPHILPDGSHLSQRETAVVLQKSGLSHAAQVAVPRAPHG
jgi:acyl-CoA dehydrogenase